MEKMMKIFDDPKAVPPHSKGDVGVIIGRFQCSYVHDGYHDLIRHVQALHSRVIIFIGVSPSKGQRRDPLDFFTRRTMLEEAYPNIEIYKLNDVGDVDRWSQKLDKELSMVIGPTQTATLYGSRDKFKYTGKYPVVAVPAVRDISSTQIRKEIGLLSQNDRKWREGVIWSTQNRFQTESVAGNETRGTTLEISRGFFRCSQ
jgi:bifunctional NMN adenylyltransferase/nudix hydrolase